MVLIEELSEKFIVENTKIRLKYEICQELLSYIEKLEYWINVEGDPNCINFLDIFQREEKKQERYTRYMYEDFEKLTTTIKGLVNKKQNKNTCSNKGDEFDVILYSIGRNS